MQHSWTVISLVRVRKGLWTVAQPCVNGDRLSQ